MKRQTIEGNESLVAAVVEVVEVVEVVRLLNSPVKEEGRNVSIRRQENGLC